MIMDNNIQLVNKIIEINKALSFEGYDFYEDIGFVKDLFSSPYNQGILAEPGVIKELWLVLFKLFCHDTSYDNKFDAAFAMSDVALYAKENKVNINIEVLKIWRLECNEIDTTSEVLEIVDDILIM